MALSLPPKGREEIMRIGITGWCRLRLFFSKAGMGLDYIDPINFQWEFWDASVLANRGHTVFWLNQETQPPKLDIVFCVIDREAGRARDIAASQAIPWVLQLINRIADYEDAAWDAIKAAMESASAFICTAPVSQRSAVKWMKQYKYRVPCEYIPFGADLALAEEAARRGPIENQQTNFTYVGSLVHHKRVDILVRAFADIPAGLCLIGDGPERDNLILQAKVLGTKLNLVGLASNMAKYRQLQTTAALVLSSTGEQFNIPTLEALACGTPVLARRLKDMEEIYGDIVDWWDEPAELVEKAKNILKNGRGDEEARRKWVIDNGLTLEARAERLEKVFEEVVTING